MNTSNDFDFLIKEEILDPSFVQNEKAPETHKKEPFVMLPSIEREDESIGHNENNKDLKSDKFREIKPDYFLHEYIKEEATFQCCATNLEESLQDPLALNDMKVENVKKEDSQIIEHIKEEPNIELKEEYTCEDIKYSIDIEEHKVEYSDDCDLTLTGYNEDIVPSSSKSGSDTSKISTEGMDISIKKPYRYECCKVTSTSGNNRKFTTNEIQKQNRQKYYESSSTAEYLKTHEDSSHKEIKYKCNECHKLFTRAKSLKLHIDSLHKGIKYECNICPKKFSTPRRLKIHVDCVHKEIKRYLCNECMNTFSSAYYLKIHCESIHKGIRYECNMCHKLFSVPEALKRHVDCVHKGIKNYECNECGEKFSQVTNLKIHCNSLHKGIRYKCSICCKMFSSPQRLKRHVEDVHTGNKNKKYKFNEGEKMF